MRKIILGLAVSLDGFIEGPKGEYDWCFTDQDYGLSDFFKQIDTIFMGRKSYEQSLKYEDQNPWKGMDTYVFSRTMKIAPANVVIIADNVVGEVQRVRHSMGKDIWLFGGAELISTFINEQLVDEIWLSIHPVVLGGGKPLFQNITERKYFDLMDTKTYSTGLVSVRYKPKTK